MNLDHQKGHSLDELIQNLAETITWCSSRPQPWAPMASFRSVDIAPEFGSNDRKSWVDSVAKQRRRRLGSRKHSLPGTIYARSEGRLLTYFPDESLACGVAEVVTGGFLSINNVPPWDTWVAYLHEDERTAYLVSWVPGKMTEILDSGIDANPEECFGWADLRRPHLVESLAASGLKITLE